MPQVSTCEWVSGPLAVRLGLWSNCSKGWSLRLWLCHSSHDLSWCPVHCPQRSQEGIQYSWPSWTLLAWLISQCRKAPSCTNSFCCQSPVAPGFCIGSFIFIHWQTRVTCPSPLNQAHAKPSTHVCSISFKHVPIQWVKSLLLNHLLMFNFIQTCPSPSHNLKLMLNHRIGDDSVEERGSELSEAIEL